MVENVSHKDKESNDIMYLAERHLLNRHGSCGSLRYQRSYPASCPVCWQGPDSYRDVPVASWYGAIFAPGLTERSERQASRCARALSRSRYK